MPDGDSSNIKLRGGSIADYNTRGNSAFGGITILAKQHASVSFVEVDNVDTDGSNTKANLFMDFSPTTYPSTDWHLHDGTWVPNAAVGCLSFAAANLGTPLTGALSGVNIPTGVNGPTIRSINGFALSKTLKTPSSYCDTNNLAPAANGSLGLFGQADVLAANWPSTFSKTVSGSRLLMQLIGGTVSVFTIVDAAGNVVFNGGGALPSNNGTGATAVVLNIGDVLTIVYTGFPVTHIFTYID